MTAENIKTLAIDLLKQIAPDTEPGSLAPDDNIRDKLEIDSFDALQFITQLDEKLGLDTPEEDYGKISTLATLCSYFEQKLNKA
ncbi:phosphopantetheine-binding protein [Flavihumibacter rivuli]|uniref:acyl carrier protein n=1 Tax=Flavihumibacter rivuli TaxID=2838156 RepID=UPI001BDE47F6|nr:phosphopantetheine-binding protein [Flavihumibacter rivuli]ULQ57610.1 phosphopantetheine-binding protein [Flavihumibacter rivuli]